MSTLLVKHATGADGFFAGTVVRLYVFYACSYLPLCSLRCSAEFCNDEYLISRRPVACHVAIT